MNIKKHKERCQVLSIGMWNVVLFADDDGHLNITVENADGSKVIQIEEDVTANDTEWGDRFTTEKIESDYREEMKAINQ